MLQQYLLQAPKTVSAHRQGAYLENLMCAGRHRPSVVRRRSLRLCRGPLGTTITRIPTLANQLTILFPSLKSLHVHAAQFVFFKGTVFGTVVLDVRSHRLDGLARLLLLLRCRLLAVALCTRLSVIGASRMCLINTVLRFLLLHGESPLVDALVFELLLEQFGRAALRREQRERPTDARRSCRLWPNAS